MKEIYKMTNIINKLLYRIQHSYLSLIGGIFLSTGVSIYVAIFLEKPDNRNIFIAFLISSILMFLSGLFWTILAFRVEILSMSVSNAPVDEVKKYSMWNKLLKKEKIIYFSLYVAVILSISSIILIPLTTLFKSS